MVDAAVQRMVNAMMAISVTGSAHSHTCSLHPSCRTQCPSCVVVGDLETRCFIGQCDEAPKHRMRPFWHYCELGTTQMR